MSVSINRRYIPPTSAEVTRGFRLMNGILQTVDYPENDLYFSDKLYYEESTGKVKEDWS